MQTLVYHHYEGLPIRPLELADQQIAAVYLGNKPTCLQTGTPLRDIRMMEDIDTSQFHVNRSEAMRLKIDIAEHVPDRCFMSELINGGHAEVSGRGCEVGEVADTSGSIGQ